MFGYYATIFVILQNINRTFEIIDPHVIEAELLRKMFTKDKLFSKSTMVTKVTLKMQTLFREVCIL